MGIKIKDEFRFGYIFNDLEEYFSYKGICDGLYDGISFDEISQNETYSKLRTKTIKECYLTGLILGSEIKNPD